METGALKRVVFTIVSANYISYAATLMQSIRLHHPRCRRVIVVADRKQEFPDLDLAAELLFCDDLAIPLIENMKLWYTVIEFNTAIKPFVFQHFMRLAADQLCYLDPDIYAYRPLDEVFAKLREHNCVLTPHIMQPLQDGMNPSDLSIMKSGVYNFGFFAIRNDTETQALVQWWADRLFAHCRVDVAANMFTDQRWMDLAPCFVGKPFILRHPGHNVAYWNLAHRRITRRNGKFYVNGRPLVFFHFSGLNPDDSKQFSKHQNRFPTVTGAVKRLCTAYRRQMLRNEWTRYKTIPYAYGSFRDGRPIEDAMRHWLARNIDQQRIDPFTPLDIGSDFFDEVDAEAEEQGCRLTRFMHQFWRDRKDVRDTFNIFQADGLDRYFNWFLTDAAHQGVDGRTIAGARRLRTVGQTDSLTAAPPWAPIAATWHNGKAAHAAEFLCGDIELTVAGVEFFLPRQAALLWEGRADLRQYFKLDTPDSFYHFVAWTVTQGVIEQSIDLSLLSPQFTEQFCQQSDLTGYYLDVPITWGMLMTRHIDDQRGFLASGRRFPVERIGRLAHGLWFAFVAPNLYGWPAEWTAPVRRYFDELSNVRVDGLVLTRASIAIWEVHPGLKTAFPLNSPESCLAFVCWLVMEGLPSLQLNIDDFDDRFRLFLAQRSPRVSGVSCIVEMVYRLRPDLQSTYDLTDPKQRAALNTWAEQNLVDLYQHLVAKPGEQPPEQERVTLALTGYWSSASGRSEDLHCSVASLDAVGFSDYCIVDLATGKKLRSDRTECASAIHAQVNICHVNADTAMHDWLHIRRLEVTADHAIGWWAWELERLPSYWRHAFSFYDEIWASTKFAEAAFRGENLRPVKVVPMAVVAPTVRKLPRSRFGIDAATKLFLFMFDFRSYIARKNPEAVIQAFRQAFPNGNEDASLLFKTIGASTAPDSWQAIRKLCDADERIRIIDTNLSRAEAFGLVAEADVFVSLHRSEGFGRGVAEAMLLNVPVIVTDYSGTSDFANEDCALLVDYDLVPVSTSDYPGVEGQRWAEPNVRQAAQHMRRVYGSNPTRMVHKAKQQIERLYSAPATGHRMLNALNMQGWRDGRFGSGHRQSRLLDEMARL